jgi:hypothetical protein
MVLSSAGSQHKRTKQGHVFQNGLGKAGAMIVKPLNFIDHSLEQTIDLLEERPAQTAVWAAVAIAAYLFLRS